MVKFAILLHTIYKCLCVVAAVALDGEQWMELMELRSRFVLRRLPYESEGGNSGQNNRVSRES